MFRKLLGSLIGIFFIGFYLTAQYIETDVLIIGGGASGVTAGLQCARLGVKTIIIEQTPWLGGMLTSAGVSATDGNNNLPSGLWAEFRDSLRKRYGGAKNVETGWVSNTQFEPHVGAEIFRNMCAKEKKLKIILEANATRIDKLIKSGEKNWHVSFKKGNEEFLTEINAQIVIDATELGDMAKTIGVKYNIGTDDPKETNEIGFAFAKTNIVQDLTYAAVLKDFSPKTAPKIKKPKNYNPKLYKDCCFDKNQPDTTQKLIACDKMLSYGKLPNKKYMINWPKHGNDFYANVIDSSDAQREIAFNAAKLQTLGFLYYIQNELGFTHLGLADDEFSTKDKLPFFPYHRESRRIIGKTTLTVNHILKPFEQTDALFKTGVAVGDYPIDHHHAVRGEGRGESGEKQEHHSPLSTLNSLNFPSVPSFNVPLGCLIPNDVENFIVAEKSISVSNIVNGTTRLQPCVMLIGQAAGVLAALSVTENKFPSQIPVRHVQNILLDAGAYIMPYYDVTPDNPHFKTIQRIGATGILKGRPEPYKWANRIWFDGDSTLQQSAINYQPSASAELLNNDLKTLVNIEKMIDMLWQYGSDFKTAQWSNKASFIDFVKTNWQAMGLKKFEPQRFITRTETAILFDKLYDPFNNIPVKLNGH